MRAAVYEVRGRAINPEVAFTELREGDLGVALSPLGVRRSSCTCRSATITTHPNRTRRPGHFASLHGSVSPVARNSAVVELSNASRKEIGLPLPCWRDVGFGPKRLGLHQVAGVLRSPLGPGPGFKVLAVPE